MAENKFCGGVRDTVCIETNRVLDSCRDRDCYEELPIYLTEFGQEIVEHTGNVRVKSAEIAWTCINIDPVPFNRGFYAVNIRFYICCQFEACMGGRNQEFEGVTVAEKKVILFGGENNVSIYKSSGEDDSPCCDHPGIFSRNVPTAVVEVVDPVVLDAKVVEIHDCSCVCCCCVDEIPEPVTTRLGGALSRRGGERVLVVTLGIFSVVRIVRPAQYLINATEYAVPDKECIASDDRNPCRLFNSMAFPVQEFSVCSFADSDAGRQTPRHCGCDKT